MFPLLPNIKSPRLSTFLIEFAPFLIEFNLYLHNLKCKWQVQVRCRRGMHQLVIGRGTQTERESERRRDRERVCDCANWPCTHPHALLTQRRWDPWRHAFVERGAPRIGSRGRNWSFNSSVVCPSTWTHWTNSFVSPRVWSLPSSSVHVSKTKVLPLTSCPTSAG